MQTQNAELPPRPPGALNALISGFNVITNNLLVILFPVALDLLLLFGPRLKVHDLFTSTFDELIRLQGDAPMVIPVATHADLERVLANSNLFDKLRTYPLGLFSLLINNQSSTSPLGTRIDWEIPNWPVLMIVFILLTCIGLFLGSLYFYFVSRVALKSQPGPSFFRAVFYSLIVWSVLTAAAYFFIIPLQLIIALMMSNQVILFVFFLLLAWPATWMGLMVFFSTHGIFISSKNAFTTLEQNFRILRHGFPPLGWFAMMAVVISQGMDLIWLTPTADTWMSLVGVLGHAFISTGLLAASFIFYRDLTTWVDEALAWLKTHQITSARA